MFFCFSALAKEDNSTATEQKTKPLSALSACCAYDYTSYPVVQKCNCDYLTFSNCIDPVNAPFCDWDPVFGCFDRSCQSLSGFSNYCRSRPDCIYSDATGYCGDYAACSCQNRYDNYYYCPCFADVTSCNEVAGCSWTNSHGCIAYTPRSSAASSQVSWIAAGLLAAMAALLQN